MRDSEDIVKGGAGSTHIREGRPADRAGIAALITAVWPSESLNDAPHGRVWVAEGADAILGVCSGFTVDEWDGTPRWEVDLLAVHPQAQGHGLGRRLVMACAAGAPAEVSHQRAVIAVGNAASQAVFKRCGFATDRIPRTLVVFSPQAGAHAVSQGVVINRVDTLTYRGLWVSVAPGAGYAAALHQGVEAARAIAATEGRDRVGVFVSPAQATDLHDAFGGTRVGEYYWFMKGAT